MDTLLNTSGATDRQLASESPSHVEAPFAKVFDRVLDLMDQRQWDAARSDLHTLLGSARDTDGMNLASAYCMLARCHHAVGDVESAREAWRLAVHAEPGNREAISALWDLVPLHFRRA